MGFSPDFSNNAYHATNESWLEIQLAAIERQPSAILLDRFAELKIHGNFTDQYLWTRSRDGQPRAMYVAPIRGLDVRAYHQVRRVIINNPSRSGPDHVAIADYAIDFDTGEVALCRSLLAGKRTADSGPLLEYDQNSGAIRLYSGDRYDSEIANVRELSGYDSDESLRQFLNDSEPFINGSHMNTSASYRSYPTA